ncbi:MAG: hypothetical protein LUF92_16265 [Clostridiales bacterium]|nr:hypothetical protein [Clostridiales bacterium]
MPKIGRQTPSTSVVLPYTESKGEEAVQIYEKTGRKAREWQKIQVYDILAVDDEGLWTHSTVNRRFPEKRVEL